MTSSGKPVDLQEELRIGGRASGLRILLEAASNGDSKEVATLAKRALARVEARVAVEQGSPQCPEAWLTGMHDVEQALRQAIDLLTGSVSE
jgi:hypothetical protein